MPCCQLLVFPSLLQVPRKLLMMVGYFEFYLQAGADNYVFVLCFEAVIYSES